MMQLKYFKNEIVVLAFIYWSK